MIENGKRRYLAQGKVDFFGEEVKSHCVVPGDRHARFCHKLTSL